MTLYERLHPPKPPTPPKARWVELAEARKLPAKVMERAA